MAHGASLTGSPAGDSAGRAASWHHLHILCGFSVHDGRGRVQAQGLADDSCSVREVVQAVVAWSALELIHLLQQALLGLGVLPQQVQAVG